MGGRGEPPEEVPGGEDEFRSVVFDESFIRAARIQELSARERMRAATHPARVRGRDRRRRRLGALPRQALALMLLIAMAFGAAVYLGLWNPYRATVSGGIELSMSVVPLMPGARGIPTASPSASVTASPSVSASVGASAGASVSASRSASASAFAGDPFAGTPAQDYAQGTAGISLPNSQRTSHFTVDQVLRALSTVQQYLVDSSLAPDVLTGPDLGSAAGGIRDLLDPSEQAQLDQSLAHPRNDRRHEITGWLVRLDPAQVRLAVDQVRVAGNVRFRELDDDTLEVISDHTFVYALQSAKGASATVLFTVRRELTYRFTHADIAGSHLEIADSVTQAGPMSCDTDASAALRPLFPTPSVGKATASASAASPSAPGIDPFDRSRPAWQVCGVLTGPTP